MGGEPIDAGAWYRPARVVVVEYDERWPSLYAEEADRIVAAIGDDLVAIEHVGSTAISGMPAKPIIDILAAVATWDRFDRMVLSLRALGYLYTPESEADDPGRRVFRKGPDDMKLQRTHHLHVTDQESGYWHRIIAFRDHLRDDPADAAAYGELKRSLARTFEHDSRRFTDGKHEFVEMVEHKRGLGVERFADRSDR
jgi:GrpB-like predicted nucleotidyltransferase (UPF0157 family)